MSDTSFKLQSKPKAGGDWTDVGAAITITYTLVEGTADGTVKFNGTDVKVHGLGSAAYTEADAYDAAGAADGVKTELLGADGDASTKATIHGVKKYAEEKANEAKTHADSAVGAAKTELIGDGAGVAATTIKGGVTEAKNYTDEQIKVKIAAVYKPAGSTTFAKLPAPTVDLLGNVYDVTDAFTADDKFKAEEQGKKYPAGTNVGVVQDGDGYKYDVLSGMVDLSKHATIEQAQGFATTAKTEAIEAAAADATEKDNAVKTALIGEGNATATTIKGAVEEANMRMASTPPWMAESRKWRRRLTPIPTRLSSTTSTRARLPSGMPRLTTLTWPRSPRPARSRTWCRTLAPMSSSTAAAPA